MTVGVVASRPLELKVFKRSVTKPNPLTSNKRWRNEIERGRRMRRYEIRWWQSREMTKRE